MSLILRIKKHSLPSPLERMAILEWFMVAIIKWGSYLTGFFIIIFVRGSELRFFFPCGIYCSPQHPRSVNFLNALPLVYMLWLNLQISKSLTCLDRSYLNFCSCPPVLPRFCKSSVASASFRRCLNNIRSLGMKRRWTACNGFSLHAAWIIDVLIAGYSWTQKGFSYSLSNTLPAS